MRTTCLIRPSRLLPCLLLTVLALMSYLAPAAEAPPRKILILYSYHPGHPWTGKVRAAIQDTLRDSDVPVEVFSEYMDVRRAGNPDHLENLYRCYKSKYDLVAPDLVLACDDEALTLLAEHRQEFLPNVPLVYSGLHAPPVSVPGAVNVLQEIEYLATLELALRLRPRTHRIVVVVDGTPTALTHEAELLKLAPALETRAEIEILSLARYPMAEVRQQLAALHQDSVVLVLGHNRDRDGQTFTFPDAMRLLRSACPVPMYSVTDSRLGLGIVGGKLVSGYSQGCAAANTALRLLRGEHLTDEAARVHVENRYMFDYTELQHFSIPLSALPPDSEVINQPPTSYPVHLHDVLIVLNVVLALCVIIGLLLRLNLQRKRADAALRAKTDELNRFFDTNLDLLCIANTDGQFLRLSRQWENTLGHPLRELLAYRFLDFVHPDDVESTLRAVADLSAQKAVVDFVNRYRHQDGSYRWLEWRSLPVGNLIYAAARDITERKNAEEALHRSEEHLQALFQNMAEGVALHELLVDASGRPTNYRIIAINPQYERILGLRSETVVGHLGTDVYGTAEPPYLAEVGRVALSGRAERLDAPFAPMGKHFDISIAPWGEKGFATIFTDITDRKRAEVALREREERYRATLASMTDLVFVLDRAGRITDCHAPRLSDLYVPPATFLGKPFADVLPPSVADLLAKATDAVRAGSPVQTVDYELELKGRRTWWSANFSARWDGAGQYDGATIVAREVTERKLMEDHLRQTEKMTAIGQLAGGIAHDFNNQLTGILGYADMLAEVCADDELKRFAKNIAVSARRAADLTQQLLAFGRKGKYLSVPVDIHRLLAEVVAILDRSIDKRIRISRVLRADRPVTLGDPTQLQNALLNLALNARDAMPQGGDLTFETDVVTLGNADCQGSPHDVVPGEYLRVRIADTGCGMSDEVKKHLFEPFFTTKQPGRGTGMGLASVYGAVRNHRGAISVDSALGRGTTFSILLPLAPEAPDAADMVEFSPAAASVRATGRVLLVDDEASVRDVAGDMLRGLGYHVVTCVDGQEAVKYYRQNWQQIDLVILDMVMPVMGGRDAFLAMRRINPGIRAILSSGYSLDGEAQAILDEGVLVFVGKPYRQSELGRKVADAMTPKQGDAGPAATPAHAEQRG